MARNLTVWIEWKMLFFFLSGNKKEAVQNNAALADIQKMQAPPEWLILHCSPPPTGPTDTFSAYGLRRTNQKRRGLWIFRLIVSPSYKSTTRQWAILIEAARC
tara:strand:+ start:1193 stop:1501 length:309 start_codon:yes stop_codon:yes gene_type:complete